MSAKIPPKPTKDTVYVDVDDEITGIIDKVENSTHKVVALVLPKRAASLQSIVNMKLLKRSADTADKSVVLITSEPSLLPLAGAAGLHVAKNLQTKPEVPDAPSHAKTIAKPAAEEMPEGEEDSAEEDLPQKFDYGRPIGALAAAHEADNPETIDLDDEDAPDAGDEPKPKSPKGGKLKVPNFDRFRMLLGLGGVALVAFIIFLIYALFILPKATITINTSSEPVSANFNLNASPGAAVDPANSTIPSKLESSDQTGSQSVQATGQQNNGQKATGSVTMSAQACAPNLGTPPTSIPAGSGITASGLTFITQEKANFSFSGFASGSCANYTSNSVSISAQQPGSKYNTNITGASVSNSSATASGSASGGTDNIVTVLSQSDVDGAKQKLTSTSGDQFTKDFKKKLSDQGEYVLASTLKASDPSINASPAVGQPASTANVTIKITYTVLTVKKSDLSQVIQTKLASQIDKSKQKLNGNFLNDANISVQSQPKPDSAVLSINEETTAVPIIDTAAVKKVAKGKKTGDIQAVINNWAGVKSVDVKLSPFWVSKVPNKDGKITVILKEVKDNSANNSAP